jgi:O-antigen ligase
VGAFKLTVGALLFITISRAHDYVGPVAAVRPGLILFGLALILLVLNPGSARLKNLTQEWPSRVVLGLVAVACLGALTGLSLTASGAFLTSIFFRLVTFFALVAISIRVIRDLRFLMAAYVISLIFLAGIIVFVVGPTNVDGMQRIGETSMYDGNDLGVVFATGIPFALLMVQAGGRWARILGWVALVVVPACIVLTGSRGGFLALAACGLGILFLMPRVTMVRRIGILGAAVVTLAVAAPDGYWEVMGTILNPEEDYNMTSDTGRMAIWTRGLGYVAAYPVFGVGPDNFIRAGWEISAVGRAGLPGVGLRSLAPHNTFLQVWAEMGTAGLILWLSIIYGGIVGCLRTRSGMPARWLHGTYDQRFLYLAASYLPVSFIGFSVATFFTSHAYTGMFYILAAFLAAFHFLLRVERMKGRQIADQRGVTPQEPLSRSSSGPPRGAYQPSSVMVGERGQLLFPSALGRAGPSGLTDGEGTVARPRSFQL